MRFGDRPNGRPVTGSAHHPSNRTRYSSVTTEPAATPPTVVQADQAGPEEGPGRGARLGVLAGQTLAAVPDAVAENDGLLQFEHFGAKLTRIA